jgi:hypothetical protein
MTALSILIPTVGERDQRFRKLVATLTPQVQKHNGSVEVVAYWNNFEKPIADIRQALVNEARGDYVCFIDDDDGVPAYYCDRIVEAIGNNPDYIGWRMQLWYDGAKMKPTYHSIMYDSWFEDPYGYYRNISHLNPVRRSIALQVPFDGSVGPEDHNWAQAIYPLIQSEFYIDDPMYFYYFNTEDSIWRGKSMPNKNYRRPTLGKHFRYHPDSKAAFVAK